MPLAVPNQFAAVAGNQPGANLDANFTTVQNYVNLRTPSTGTLAARPAAGNAGAVYLATDVAGGTLYVDNGAAWVAAAVAPSSDPTVTYVLHEDFQGPLDNLAAGVGAEYRLPTGIYLIAVSAAGQGYIPNTDARGIFRLLGDGANIPQIFGPYVDLGGVTLKLPVKASDNPTLTVRCGNNGAQNNTRRIGAAATGLTVDPANGIFIRWAAAGNYFAVCRAATVESALDLGIASSVTMRTFKLAITAALVTCFVDGVQKGTIATNIPAVGMGIGAGLSTNVITDGMDIDFLNVTFTR